MLPNEVAGLGNNKAVLRVVWMKNCFAVATKSYLFHSRAERSGREMTYSHGSMCAAQKMGENNGAILLGRAGRDRKWKRGRRGGIAGRQSRRVVAARYRRCGCRPRIRGREDVCRRLEGTRRAKLSLYANTTNRFISIPGVSIKRKTNKRPRGGDKWRVDRFGRGDGSGEGLLGSTMSEGGIGSE